VKETEIKARVQQALQDAENHSSKVKTDRRKALDYYSGEPVGDFARKHDWESSVVSTDVADTIEWMMPSLINIFVSGSKAVEFTPQNPEDEQASKQSTEYINYLFFKKNEGFKVLNTLFKDALLQKTGVVKVFWDTEKVQKVERYSGLTQEQLIALDNDENVEITEASSDMSGNFDVVAHRSLSKGGVVVQNVPPNDFYVSSRAHDTESADFLCHKVSRTLSELRASGYKNVDKITSEQTTYSEANSNSTIFQNDYEVDFNDRSNIDKTLQRVTLAECYMQIDVNGDGIAEWRKIVLAGNQILENVEIDAHPFVAVSPIPLPHTFYGLSVADLAMSPQKSKTAILRAMLDGLYRTIRPRYAVLNGKVDYNELVSPSPWVTVQDQTAITPLQLGQPDIANGMAMLEFLETSKENRTGWTRYSQGTSSDSLNQTATGVNIITARGDMRIQMIARVFAEYAVKPMFLKMLKLVCQYQDTKTMFRLNNKFIEVDPREWDTQFDVSINVGLGSGNKDQIAGHIMQLLNIQKEALQIGVATPENIYKAALKLAENLGLSSSEDYFTDPSMQQMQGKEDKLAQIEQEKLSIEKEKLELERQKAMAKIQLEREKMQAEIELEREKMIAEIELEREKSQAKLNIENQIPINI
jgi:hypothetical protein